MTAGHAIVPVVGGFALMFGGALALYVDRLDVIREGGPFPALIRYTSLATYNLKKRPHWIFVGTCIIFSPSLILTSMWQAQFIENWDNNSSSNSDLSDRIRLFGILTAIGGYLVAILPMGTALGCFIHMITSCMFCALGLNYSFTTATLAQEQDRDTLAFIRVIFGSIAVVGAAVIVFTTPIGIQASYRLEIHKELAQSQSLNSKEALAKEGKSPLAIQTKMDENGTTKTPKDGTTQTKSTAAPPFLGVQESVRNLNRLNDAITAESDEEAEDVKESFKMDHTQIVRARLAETVLALGQMLIATSFGLILISCAVEVIDMEETDMGSLYAGVLSFISAVLVAHAFGSMNNRCYTMCQSKTKTEPENIIS